MARYVTIWFRHLKTDWFSVRQPALRNRPFVLATPEQGRMVITACNAIAEEQGIEAGMVVADARAIFPSLEILDDIPDLPRRLLKVLARWCIRYTDFVSVDHSDGLILDVTGCAHLWGGEEMYIREINLRLQNRGYDVRATMADTIGCSWAIAHYGNTNPIVRSGLQWDALLSLPPAALRIEAATTERLMKLGLRQVRQFIQMPRAALRRRFGKELLLKLDQALGHADEPLVPVQPVEPFRERLPCLEPIATAGGIEIALERLLDIVCNKLRKENMGIRKVAFIGYRVDNQIEKIEIGTNRATFNKIHLYKLFKEKISSIEPALGIELFILDVLKSEPVIARQEKFWAGTSGLQDTGLSELLDRFINRFGPEPIHRYMPDEHHWPERSVKEAPSLHEPLVKNWKADRPRPLQLLPKPQRIDVAAPVPDYPPMSFRFRNVLHKIKKADGPERIEPEWWIAEGLHRDYYAVEDEEGKRYWLFRLGHYAKDRSPLWFIHGFFA